MFCCYLYICVFSDVPLAASLKNLRLELAQLQLGPHLAGMLLQYITLIYLCCKLFYLLFETWTGFNLRFARFHTSLLQQQLHP